MGNAKSLRSFSYVDIENGIKIPRTMNSQMAELIGVIIGDGYMHKSKNKIIITGNGTEEWIYYNKRLCNLVDKLFNYKGRVHLYNFRNACYLQIGSKAIFLS